VHRAKITRWFGALLFVAVALAAASRGAAAQTGAPAVASLTLVDAAGDVDIAAHNPLVNGATIDLSKTGPSLNIRANTNPATVGSVKFVLTGSQSRTHVENGAPYALFSNNGPDYYSWRPPPGTYQLTVTPYTGANASQTAGTASTVTFHVVNTAPPPGPMSGRFEYVFPDYGIEIYDIGNGHKHVKTIPIPGLTNVRGVAASAATGKLFITNGHNTPNAEMIAFDLATDTVTWRRTYSPGVDSHCITPDGKIVYLPTGEEHAISSDWLVVDAATGNVLTRIAIAPRGHNTVCSLDGTRAYMGAVLYPYLSVVDTATNQVVKRVGPFGEGVRPFTINGTNTLAFVNVNYLLGFEVGDIRTSQKIYRVEIPGFPKPSGCTEQVPSHGIGLTPDEKEVWVVNSCHNHLHVFDVTALPGAAPRKLADIKLTGPPKWISFSLDGRFAYVSTGDVIDVATRQPVAKLAASRKFLEVDFEDGKPVRVSSRHGLGYSDVAPPEEPPSAPTGQALTSLTLVNADTDRDIATLNDGDTISFGAIGTNRLNVRANTSPSVVGSVRFALDSNSNYKLENSAPYALAGNAGSDYYAWTPATGSHTLTATPFSAANGGGTAGTPLTIRFTVTS
jgi:DNA-binding beta-propeller fold protein YncE